MNLSQYLLNSLLKHIISFLLIFSFSVNMSLPVISRQTLMARSAITLVDRNAVKRDATQLYRFAASIFQQGIPFIIVFLKQSLSFGFQVRLSFQIQRKTQLELGYLAPVVAHRTPLYSSEKTNSNLYIG
jgi:hypothetical protein